MASSERLHPLACNLPCLIDLAKIPKPKDGGVVGGEEEQPPSSASEIALPQTLVRIPVDDQQAEDQEPQA